MDRNKIINHLTFYKLNTLNITEDGEWWKNHKKYSHILPIERKYENIINKSFRTDLENLLKSDTVHLGFHHLNSSQALALNLFGPLVVSKQLSIIDKNIFNDSKGHFEYIQDKRENTNFDFFVLNNENRFYFEVKYTENDFGKAKDDSKHKQKYLEIYKDKLENIANVSEKDFYKEYQIWRNIIYAESGYVFFVLPDFRTDLISKVKNVKCKIKNSTIENRVNILSINSLISKAKEIKSLQEHYIEFEKKYLHFD